MRKKKWREIRSAVTMMCVMAAMLSSATYAWFTLTSSPTVAGLQMTASSTGGLVVSNYTDTDFSGAIQVLDSTAQTLVPVTPYQGASTSGFCLPVYEGSYVAGLDTANMLDTAGELTDHVAVYTYYIKAEGDSTVDVGIITGDAAQSSIPTVTTPGVANATGTFVRPINPGTDSAAADASDAIRIGLVVYSDATSGAPGNIESIIVLEPNSDGTFGGTASYAPVKQVDGVDAVQYDSTNFPVAVQFETDGDIVSNAATDTDLTDNISQSLFSVGASAKKVIMYVWIEGTDGQCINQIMSDQLEGQIQFTIVD